MMKRTFVFTVTIIFLGAATLSTQGKDGSEYEAGKTIYHEKCQMCHGENGKGDGTMASAFSTPPADFTKPGFWENNPDQKIMKAVENGYKLMPRIDLTPTQIKNVIDYLTKTFKR